MLFLSAPLRTWASEKRKWQIALRGNLSFISEKGDVLSFWKRLVVWWSERAEWSFCPLLFPIRLHCSVSWSFTIKQTNLLLLLLPSSSLPSHWYRQPLNIGSRRHVPLILSLLPALPPPSTLGKLQDSIRVPAGWRHKGQDASSRAGFDWQWSWCSKRKIGSIADSGLGDKNEGTKLVVLKG